MLTQLSSKCAGAQVAGLTVSEEYNSHFQRLFTIFMTQLQGILPNDVNIAQAYDRGTDDEQAFIQNLALFFTAFFKASWRPCHSAYL